jgi:hypothetical protein
MGGYKVYKDLSVTGGFKHLSLDIEAELGNGLKASTAPGLWDPMIGVDWRRMVTDDLQLNVAFEGGGFGVGTDVDLSGHMDVDWEVFPHFVLNAGYGFFYFKATVARVAVGGLQREFVTEQTLHGPRIGLGFVF